MIDDKTTPCPFLGEMVVMFCQAYPVRKPVPKHLITASNPCAGKGYKGCPFFKDIMAGLGGATGVDPALASRDRKGVTS
jgi:hypothetical protein